MMKSFKVAVLSLAVVAALGATPIADDPGLHFGLAKSVPEADSSVESPSVVRLWFTEVPAEGTASIRVVGAEDAGVHVMEIVQDEEDPRSFSVELHGTLPAGTHTVAWRGMGADGHVVRESFDFIVIAGN